MGLGKFFNLVPLNLLPLTMDFNNFHSHDPNHSDNFLKKCSKFQHNELTHKVYVLYSTQSEEIVGFFSLHMNRMEGKLKKESMKWPFLDVAFLSISNKHFKQSEKFKKVLRVFLEKIDAIAIDISNKVGCRFIRVYASFEIGKKMDPYKVISGEPLTPHLLEMLDEYEYSAVIDREDPEVWIKKKIVVKTKASLVFKYYIRNLKIKEKE